MRRVITNPQLVLKTHFKSISKEDNFFFYQNEYYGDFNNPICDEVNVDWHCPPTYYVYFDDDDNVDNDIINNNNNGSVDIIDALLLIT
jgi:hypothetical protein